MHYPTVCPRLLVRAGSQRLCLSRLSPHGCVNSKPWIKRMELALWSRHNRTEMTIELAIRDSSQEISSVLSSVTRVVIYSLVLLSFYLFQMPQKGGLGVNSDSQTSFIWLYPFLILHSCLPAFLKEQDLSQVKVRFLASLGTSANLAILGLNTQFKRTCRCMQFERDWPVRLPAGSFCLVSLPAWLQCTAEYV